MLSTMSRPIPVGAASAAFFFVQVALADDFVKGETTESLGLQRIVSIQAGFTISKPKCKSDLVPTISISPSKTTPPGIWTATARGEYWVVLLDGKEASGKIEVSTWCAMKGSSSALAPMPRVTVSSPLQEAK